MQPPPLASEPRILDTFSEALLKRGVVGEARAAKLMFLAIVSRMLPRPVSLAVKGPSSGGKSHLVRQVLAFFPKSAYYELTAMSERALAYSKEPVVHRVLVIHEASAIRGPFLTYLLRSLLSEGYIRYETVEGTKEGLKPLLIERPGPTGLIVTTTADRLHPENENRMLSVTVTDTPEQTRAVMEAAANGHQLRSDLSEWHDLHAWLDVAEHGVAIPYAEALARAIPPVAVRLRRDFTTTLALIQTHAILHQLNRDRDETGAILATLEDYTVAHDLVADLVAEGAGAGVDPIVRETVEAVASLLAQGRAKEVSVTALAARLAVDKSTASRRVRKALSAGYLRNYESRRNQQARLVLGDAMPEDRTILPRPEALSGCTVAPEKRGRRGGDP